MGGDDDRNTVELIDEHVASMRRRNLAPTSINKRRQRLTRFDRDVGLATATAEQINEYLDTIDCEARARYQWISDLHCFYEWAITWGHLSVDPTVKVDRPKLRRRLPRPIDTADLAMALDMAGTEMRAWLSLAAFAGLRVSEIAGLDMDCLLWSDQLIRVLGKGDKERMVPMHPEVEKVLRAMHLPTRGRVFRRPRGGGWPANEVSREMSLYFDSLHISATAHQCRHWFGTQTYKACGDLRVVQELMGHSSPTTTAAYADWSRREARAAVTALSLSDAGEATLFTEWPATG